MKMTATMRKLLQNRSLSGLVYVQSGHYSGARSGSFGQRDSDAADRLLEAGLIILKSSSRNRVIINQGRTTVHTSERVYTITANGYDVIRFDGLA
jgi:hypothetical protein